VAEHYLFNSESLNYANIPIGYYEGTLPNDICQNQDSAVETSTRRFAGGISDRRRTAKQCTQKFKGTGIQCAGNLTCGREYS
jgi:hypothetical protein